MAERLLSADLKNIVKKVADGKTLSPSELNRVKSIASGSNETVTHARNIAELAMLLGVSRQTLYQWKKLEVRQSHSRMDCILSLHGGSSCATATSRARIRPGRE
jgi:transposase-like protein